MSTPPPGWSQTQFDDWLNALKARATLHKTSYIYTRTPYYLTVNMDEYIATGTTTTPLPTGWSLLEFTDFAAALVADGTAAYYEYIYSRTPSYMQTAVAAALAGTTVDSYTLLDGTKAAIVIDPPNNIYYDGTSTPSSLGALWTGAPTADAGGMIMPGDNSIQAKGALATAFANAAGATVAAMITGGGQMTYQFPLTMGANAFCYLGGGDNPIRAVSYSAALPARLAFNPSDWGGPTVFSSGYDTVNPKRSAMVNDQTAQEDNNGYDANTPIYLGWWTGGSFPFKGRMTRLAVWPGKRSAAQLPQLRALTPFNIAPRKSLVFGPTSFGILPSGALKIERTQPWSALINFAATSTNSTFGQVLFTNVIGIPWCGYEIWIQGSGSGRTAGRICVRIMSDLNGDSGPASAIDTWGSIPVIDGYQYMIAATYDGSSLAAGIKMYVLGVPDTGITTAQNNLTSSITGNAGQMWIGNQLPGTQFGSAMINFMSMYDIVLSPTFIAAHASYDTRPPVDSHTTYYADFSAGGGATLPDLSSHAYTAALTGVTWYP